MLALYLRKEITKGQGGVRGTPALLETHSSTMTLQEDCKKLAKGVSSHEVECHVIMCLRIADIVQRCALCFRLARGDAQPPSCLAGGQGPDLSYLRYRLIDKQPSSEAAQEERLFLSSFQVQAQPALPWCCLSSRVAGREKAGGPQAAHDPCVAQRC